MEIKARYSKGGNDVYVPQYSTDNGVTWKNVGKKLLDENPSLLRLAESIAKITNNGKFIFTNADELYFVGEMWVCAWLAAFKIYTKSDIKEFELF